jgi:hypothetical protein
MSMAIRSLRDLSNTPTWGSELSRSRVSQMTREILSADPD